MKLSERVEAASAEQQGYMLLEAWNALNPPSLSSFDDLALARRRFAFSRMLDAEAYESAALMLVPQGDWSLYSPEPGTKACAQLENETSRENFALVSEGQAATPALAFLAAILRSKEL